MRALQTSSESPSEIEWVIPIYFTNWIALLAARTSTITTIEGRGIFSNVAAMTSP